MLNEWNSKVKHEVSLFSKNDLTPRGGGKIFFSTQATPTPNHKKGAVIVKEMCTT